jgi:hypothetical protein
MGNGDNPLTIALIAAASSIIGSLLTIWLTPRLQHHFWKFQRRDDLRLAAINEFNRLTSDFVTEYIAAPTMYRPSAEWFKAFSALSGNVKALFSDWGFVAFKAVEVMIGRGTPGLGALGNKTANDFADARDAALRALYGEVIPIRRRVSAAIRQ